MFFSKSGEYPASGIYGLAHFLILSFCIIAIIILLIFTKKFNQKQVRKTIGIFGIVFVGLEICKIIFVITNYGVSNVNSWVPLYFCSIFEFGAILSGFGKGKVQKVGDSFLYYGGIVAGIVFLVYPSTSIVYYPWFHFITFHSFLLHSAMIYCGILLVVTKTYIPNIKDVLYYSTLILVWTILALIVNSVCDSNLMFVSHNFDSVPLLNFLWNTFGNIGFALIITLAQTIGLFYTMQGIYTLIVKIAQKHQLKNKGEIINE